MEEYFKDKLKELREDAEVANLFNRANKKICEETIQKDRTLFHNDSVQSYYNMAKGTLENYKETGVYSHNDIPELANYTYQYYLALKFAANNCEYEEMKFDYDEKSIDNIVSEFLQLVKDINNFNMWGMMQD